MRRSQKLTALAVVALAFIARGNALAGSPATTQNRVKLHDDSVLASNLHQGIDARLSPVSHRLQLLFSYSSYQLLSHDDGEANLGNQVSFKLPSGHILDVEPRELDHDMIVMQMVLFEADKPLMTTDLKLRNHGTLIVGGRKYDDGMLIISIVADSPASPIANGGDGSPAIPGRAVSTTSAVQE